MQMLAEVDPELAVPEDRMRPLAGERWELKAVIDEECQRGLEQLRGLLSHVDPHMKLGKLVGRLVKEGLDRHDPGRPRRGRKPGSRSAGAERTSAPKTESNSEGAADTNTSTVNAQTDQAGTGSSATVTQRDVDRRASSAALPPAQSTGTGASAPNSQGDLERQTPSAATRPAWTTTSAPKTYARAGRAIPAAVKREVWQRDGGRCRYVHPGTGRRCASRYLLQIDHVVSYAMGGGAEPENLRLLCAAHHRYRHEERASQREPAD